ncbi:unnamed protein product [Bursaphelenchus okinawaensis]|uniref:Peptidase A1 domain-containing protein n=1 Tax=Bursaphelenchus okinawaensis TaxID=465554 RepID=A0A811L5I0_9BILA|nr:unnamed protein product [Bursaphelenchus okinawaensis]CAG9117082.1 unnamed protein product [Bursaphelenchus okinawaensis]
MNQLLLFTFFIFTNLHIVGSVIYDAEKGTITAKFGDKVASDDIILEIQPLSNEVRVFGQECEKADSCTQQWHPTFDVEKNTAKKGKELTENGLKCTVYDDVTVKFGKAETKLTVGVYDGITDDAQILPHYSDGKFGIGLDSKILNELNFVKLVNTQNASSQFLVFVPKHPTRSKSVGKMEIGKNDEEACGKITLESVVKDSNGFSAWATDSKATFDDKTEDIKLFFSFTSTHKFSTSLIEKYFKNDNVNQEQYHEMKDITITLQNLNVTVPKDQLYKKDGQYYKKLFLPTNGEFDVELGNPVLKDYCVKLTKFEDASHNIVFQIGLGLRKNSASIIGYGSFVMFLMFYLVNAN